MHNNNFNQLGKLNSLSPSRKNGADVKYQRTVEAVIADFDLVNKAQITNPNVIKQIQYPSKNKIMQIKFEFGKMANVEPNQGR